MTSPSPQTGKKKSETHDPDPKPEYYSGTLEGIGNNATGYGKYEKNTTVSIYAGTKEGYTFTGWYTDKERPIRSPRFALTLTPPFTLAGKRSRFRTRSRISRTYSTTSPRTATMKTLSSGR